LPLRRPAREASRAGRDDSGRCPNGMAGAAATDDV